MTATADVSAKNTTKITVRTRSWFSKMMAFSFWLFRVIHSRICVYFYVDFSETNGTVPCLKHARGRDPIHFTQPPAITEPCVRCSSPHEHNTCCCLNVSGVKKTSWKQVKELTSSCGGSSGMKLR